MYPLTTEIFRSSLVLPRRVEQHYKLCFYVFCTMHCDSYVILTNKMHFLNYFF